MLLFQQPLLSRRDRSGPPHNGPESPPCDARPTVCFMGTIKSEAACEVTLRTLLTPTGLSARARMIHKSLFILFHHAGHVKATRAQSMDPAPTSWPRKGPLLRRPGTSSIPLQLRREFCQSLSQVSYRTRLAVAAAGNWPEEEKDRRMRKGRNTRPIRPCTQAGPAPCWYRPRRIHNILHATALSAGAAFDLEKSIAPGRPTQDDRRGYRR